MRLAPLLLVLAAAAANAASSEHFIEHGGAKRRYVVYEPAAADGSRLRPALINFHGGGGHAEQHERSSGMDRVADRHGFFVVYPDGSSAGSRLLTWNAGRCCGYAVRRKVDDVGFVRKVIAEVVRDYPVDPERVFIAGHSNGAMFAYRFAAEASELVAGAGIVAGSLEVNGPAPSRPVPLVVFHGLKDQNVLWQGGKGPNQFDPVPHRAIPETLAIWKKWDHCEDAPAKTVRTTDYVMERCEPAAAGGAPIVLYKLPNGGHTWPGGEPGAKFLNLGPHVTTVDASELMWQFFASLKERR